MPSPFSSRARATARTTSPLTYEQFRATTGRSLAIGIGWVLRNIRHPHERGYWFVVRYPDTVPGRPTGIEYLAADGGSLVGFTAVSRHGFYRSGVLFETALDAYRAYLRDAGHAPPDCEDY